MADKKMNGFDSTLKEIRALVKGSKINEKQNKTGSSFFEGTKRFCKIVQTGKENIYLELNVHLPKELEKLAGMSTFSKVEASKKHLGTLVHIYRTNEDAKVKEILTAGWKAFRAEVAKEAVASKSTGAETKVEDKAQASGKGKNSGKNGKNKNGKGQEQAKIQPGSNLQVRALNEEDINRLKKLEDAGKLKNHKPEEDKKPVDKAIETLDKAFNELEQKEQQELEVLNK